MFNTKHKALDRGPGSLVDLQGGGKVGGQKRLWDGGILMNPYFLKHLAGLEMRFIPSLSHQFPLHIEGHQNMLSHFNTFLDPQRKDCATHSCTAPIHKSQVCVAHPHNLCLQVCVHSPVRALGQAADAASDAAQALRTGEQTSPMYALSLPTLSCCHTISFPLTN